MTNSAADQGYWFNPTPGLTDIFLKCTLEQSTNSNTTQTTERLTEQLDPTITTTISKDQSDCTSQPASTKAKGKAKRTPRTSIRQRWPAHLTLKMESEILHNALEKAKAGIDALEIAKKIAAGSFEDSESEDGSE
ncbi:hypothetical protein FRC07_014929 [Ceratobasidium sp. 392]|nr:hypothetical protein FRC07_014929 [Ceratobasidium sp. 392]